MFTAVANAVLLIGVAGFVLYEAIERIGSDPQVPGLTLIVVALVGLTVNVLVMFLLRADSQESIAVRGAYLEVLADAVGSVGVLVAGIVALTTGWGYADIIVAVGIALWVVPRALRLAVDASVSSISRRPPTSTSTGASRVVRDPLGHRCARPARLVADHRNGRRDGAPRQRPAQCRSTPGRAGRAVTPWARSRDRPDRSRRRSAQMLGRSQLVTAVCLQLMC